MVHKSPSSTRGRSLISTGQVRNLRTRVKKEPRSFRMAEKTGLITGDDLLSQDLSSHYHRRTRVSLPGSEWDRVVPLCYGHQRPYFVAFYYDLRPLRAIKKGHFCQGWSEQFIHFAMVHLFISTPFSGIHVKQFWDCY